MANARSGAWTEACEPQNIVSSPILSLIGIYVDSVTLKRLRSNSFQLSTMAAAMNQIADGYTKDTISKPHLKPGDPRRPVSNCCPVIVTGQMPGFECVKAHPLQRPSR